MFKEFYMIFVIVFFFCLFFLGPYFFYYFSVKGILYGGLLLKTLLILYVIYLVVNYFLYHSAWDGNGSINLRSKYFFGIVRDYFPIEIRKTAELPPNRNYVLAHFPHGILTLALSVNLIFEINPFLSLYPGIRPKIATLNANFCTPFLRELLRLLGFVPASKKGLLHFLNKSNDPKHPDNADGFTSYLIGISVGGVQEAAYSKPGHHTIVLKERKGFVKLAIQTGSSIVPSFGFGENDIYTLFDKTWFRPLQVLYKRLFRYAPLLIAGRGNTVIPYKKRLALVVGNSGGIAAGSLNSDGAPELRRSVFTEIAYRVPIILREFPRRQEIISKLPEFGSSANDSPIDVKKIENPDPAYIDEIHGKVVEAVYKLFETYKSEYIQNSGNLELIIK